MSLDPSLVAIVLYMLGTSATAAVWVFRLATRVAVLEAGHDMMAHLLHEIKADIKELVNALHGSDPAIIRRKRKP